MRHLTLALLLLLAACGDKPSSPEAKAPESDAPPFVEFSRPVMGTEVRIKIYAADPQAALTAAKKAMDEIERLDGILSDYKPDSELMKLCAAPNDEPTPVSQELYDALSMALGLAQRTKGLYDPTVGAYTHLWRKAKRGGTRPTDAELAEAKTRVGWQKVELHPPTRSVRLAAKGMQLDLGGFGKGYAAQTAWAVLGMAGYPQCLVDIGGDIVVGEAPTGRNGWHIVTAEGTGLTVSNCAVASSGPSDRSIPADGTVYGHILDPRTGMGVTNGQTSVVIAQDAASADVFATVLCILPITEGIATADGTDGVEAWVFDAKGEGNSTSGFDDLLDP